MTSARRLRAPTGRVGRRAPFGAAGANRPRVRSIVRAAEAGATVVSPPENQFWGDRSGTIEDPFGHHWHIGSHVEDVSPEELGRRAAAMMEAGEHQG